MQNTPVLGIMSGTSLGSVDYALCLVGRSGVRLEKLWSVDFPPQLEKRLQAAARGEATSWELAQCHHDLGRFYAQGAQAKRLSRRPALIGLHGQTIFHNPGPENPATLQLGEPAYLAEALRAPVVSNFRAADLAAGGQGAPLATLFHLIVFARRGRHVCVNNLGGISNVTSLDWTKGSLPRVLAFDTGPANLPLDLTMRHFTGGKKSCDHNGGWAARGHVSERLLSIWLKHPFFKKTPPKSTGRELFGEVFLRKAWMHMAKAKLSRFDALATLTEFGAASLALNYRRHLPGAPALVILAGGGTANPPLVAAIRRQLLKQFPSVSIVTGDSLGWPAQAIEPSAFALLAWRRLNRLPGNLPATTGARRAVLCGQITAPWPATAS